MKIWYKTTFGLSVDLYHTLKKGLSNIGIWTIVVGFIIFFSSHHEPILHHHDDDVSNDRFSTYNPDEVARPNVLLHIYMNLHLVPILHLSIYGQDWVAECEPRQVQVDVF